MILIISYCSYIPITFNLFFIWIKYIENLIFKTKYYYKKLLHEMYIYKKFKH